MDKYSIIQSIWVILSLWSILYIGDYYFTIRNAKSYQEILEEHMTYEGSFELTPEYIKDVDDLRMFSPNFIARWLLSLVVFYLLWMLSNPIGIPQLFYFLIGSKILVEGAVYVRHIRLYGSIKSFKAGAISGKITYSRWYTYKQSTWDLIGFSFLFFLLSVIESSWFFIGGMVGCLITACKHKALALKCYRAAVNLGNN